MVAAMLLLKMQLRRISSKVYCKTKDTRLFASLIDGLVNRYQLVRPTDTGCMNESNKVFNDRMSRLRVINNLIESE
jgi:hypothetical protein